MESLTASALKNKTKDALIAGFTIYKRMINNQIESLKQENVRLQALVVGNNNYETEIESLKEENLKLKQCIIEKDGKIESLELNLSALESQIIAAEVITAEPVENMSTEDSENQNTSTESVNDKDGDEEIDYEPDETQNWKKYPDSKIFQISSLIIENLDEKVKEVLENSTINITNIKNHRDFNINKYVNEVMLDSFTHDYLKGHKMSALGGKKGAVQREAMDPVFVKTIQKQVAKAWHGIPGGSKEKLMEMAKAGIKTFCNNYSKKCKNKQL